MEERIAKWYRAAYPDDAEGARLIKYHVTFKSLKRRLDLKLNTDAVFENGKVRASQEVIDRCLAHLKELEDAQNDTPSEQDDDEYETAELVRLRNEFPDPDMVPHKEVSETVQPQEEEPSLDDSVRDWYVKKYPDDPNGMHIIHSVTFKSLQKRLANKEDLKTPFQRWSKNAYIAMQENQWLPIRISRCIARLNEITGQCVPPVVIPSACAAEPVSEYEMPDEVRYDESSLLDDPCSVEEPEQMPAHECNTKIARALHPSEVLLNRPVWLEVKDNDLYPTAIITGMSFHRTEKGVPGGRVMDANGNRFCWSDYGITWRCWTFIPDADQQRTDWNSF